MTGARHYPRYRAPQEDRQILCVPSWSSLQQIVHDVRHAEPSTTVEILGRPLRELAREARRELIEQAQQYTNAYADSTVKVDAARPLIVTGHQPDFVHPGVWLKNFAAAQLAQSVGGAAISLVIDNDLSRTPSIRVPTGTVDQPRAVDIAYDQPQPDMPYEERTIVDRSLWNSFGQRVTESLAALVPEPLLADWWPEVLAISDQTQQLGMAIAMARHRLEMSWGSKGFEVPQSKICETTSFRRFAVHLLSSGARLRSAYNDALADYRHEHRLRSPAQPLPDLAEIEGWTETPFWVWTQENSTRRALFVKSDSNRLLLTDRLHWEGTLPFDSDNPESAIHRFEEWQQQGVKLRTRALMTTLYARLLLADVFIHGIGGAKYDQVTDGLCERFFGILPPAFVTISGTLRLPIEHATVAPNQVNELRRTLRDLRFHPEVHLQDCPIDAADQQQVELWIKQKNDWVRTAKSSSNAAERHAQIVAANEALQAWIRPRREKLELELSTTIAQTRTNRLLESREYPFCLFPRDLLRNFLLDFSR